MYQWEMKKQIKIEEGEVMGMLNSELRETIQSFITGRILLCSDFF